MAHARLKDRQMTCGSAECKREWHRRSCARWNRENIDYFRANYLHEKLRSPPSDSPAPRHLGGEQLAKEIQEVIGLQHLIIIEYFGRLLIRRFQDLIKTQHVGIVRKLSQLPPS